MRPDNELHHEAERRHDRWYRDLYGAIAAGMLLLLILVAVRLMQEV